MWLVSLIARPVAKEWEWKGLLGHVFRVAPFTIPTSLVHSEMAEGPCNVEHSVGGRARGGCTERRLTWHPRPRKRPNTLHQLWPYSAWSAALKLFSRLLPYRWAHSSSPSRQACGDSSCCWGRTGWLAVWLQQSFAPSVGLAGPHCPLWVILSVSAGPPMDEGDGKFPWGNIRGEDLNKGPDKGAAVPSDFNTWNSKATRSNPFKFATRKKKATEIYTYIQTCVNGYINEWTLTK